MDGRRCFIRMGGRTTLFYKDGWTNDGWTEDGRGRTTLFYKDGWTDDVVL